MNLLEGEADPLAPLQIDKSLYHSENISCLLIFFCRYRIIHIINSVHSIWHRFEIYIFFPYALKLSSSCRCKSFNSKNKEEEHKNAGTRSLRISFGRVIRKLFCIRRLRKNYLWTCHEINRMRYTFYVLGMTYIILNVTLCGKMLRDYLEISALGNSFEGNFAVGKFAVGNFAVRKSRHRKFCRTDFSPYENLAVKNSVRNFRGMEISSCLNFTFKWFAAYIGFKQLS